MTVDEQISELWKAHHKNKDEIKSRIEEVSLQVLEVKTVLMGIDGANGLRSKVQNLDAQNKEEHKALKDTDNTMNDKLVDIYDQLCTAQRRIDAGVAWGKQIWEKDRHLPGMCIGNTSLNEYKKELLPQMAELNKRIETLEEAGIKGDGEKFRAIIKWIIGIFLSAVGGILLLNLQAIINALIGVLK